MKVVACLVCHSEGGEALRGAFLENLSLLPLLGVILPFLILFALVSGFHSFKDGS